ncbi:hypothetical protein [Naumannella halotolerans]|uniref:Pilus assembly protein Flp/PilA n=1 Tax=Naumannella halotolerans TaxID=993414 RepID=A0A4R7J4L8_9ACTN|nr:hypothetical protein [Naumannella halotolerans]TDT31283.1 hypothetical protein CLV29_2698 [Naumannella halotolerans]
MNSFLITIFATLQATLDNRLGKRDSGQGTLEYVGMIAVAAVVIVAVITVLQGAELGTWVQGFIDNVKSSVSAG